jgi:cobyrinic acid a,c-diamide synthase
MAGSVAALVRGFETHMKTVNVTGVILNRVGSARHEKLLREAIKRSCRAKVIGAIPRTDGIDIPSRHLGLTTDVPSILTRKYMKTLTGLIENHIDMGALIKVASKARRPDAALKDVRIPKPKARLAVAMDEAFCFYYRYNLDLLEVNGLEIVPFSPLKDGSLPENISGIYFGGGYPEMYARGLGMNDFIKRDIVEAAEAEIPIYAECGGLMYLTEGIRDTEGVYHQMVGLLPTKARMLERRKALGYREVTVRSGKNIFTPGKKARGHEFHYSDIDFMPTGVKRVYKVLKPSTGEVEKEGYVTGSVLASYVHLHFASNKDFAKSFAEKVKSVRVPHTRS